MTEPRIVWDKDALPSKKVIGTKAYNLMVMKQAGLPVPRFFTAIGSSDKSLEEKIVEGASQIDGDLMIRSCHPMESGKHPFSGEFSSEWSQNEPEEVLRNYLDVRKSASDENVVSYVAKHQIQGFNPEAMNVIFMQNYPHRFFAMYMTSLQNNPDEMLVNVYDHKRRAGVWEVFDKVQMKPRKRTYFDDTANALQSLGELGVKVERLFGKPVQIEGAVNENGEASLFQAKEIEFTDPNSICRLPEYTTMTTDLHVQGLGSFNLPVLVFDELNRAFNYRRGDRKALMTEYQTQIEQFVQANPQYVAVLKVLDDFFHDHENPSRQGYNFLNRVLKSAVVQIRSKFQGLVRHESWDNIEQGGVTIFSDYDHQEFIEHFRHSREPGQDREDFSYSSGSSIFLKGKLTPLNLVHKNVYTGDKLNVLSNQDGVFLW